MPVIVAPERGKKKKEDRRRRSCRNKKKRGRSRGATPLSSPKGEPANTKNPPRARKSFSAVCMGKKKGETYPLGKKKQNACVVVYSKKGKKKCCPVQKKQRLEGEKRDGLLSRRAHFAFERKNTFPLKIPEKRSANSSYSTPEKGKEKPEFLSPLSGKKSKAFFSFKRAKISTIKEKGGGVAICYWEKNYIFHSSPARGRERRRNNSFIPI